MLQKMIYGILGVAVFLAVIGNCNGCDSGSSSRSPHEVSYQMSKRFVKAKMNYPETADFDTWPIEETDMGGGLCKVRGYVTAKNAFGVPERKLFTCVLQYSGTGDVYDDAQWEATALYFNDAP